MKKARAVGKRWTASGLAMAVLFVAPPSHGQETTGGTEPGFFSRLRHRVYVGEYSSYFPDDIRMAQVGYDCSLPLIELSPGYHLMDIGLGADMLVALDDRGGAGAEGRPMTPRITPGGELNWSMRLYAPTTEHFRARFFLEGLGMTLVAYARKYPDTGTYLNIGSHVGLGVEYPIGGAEWFTALRLFHSSNGKPYEHNPALNALGLLVGVKI